MAIAYTKTEQGLTVSTGTGSPTHTAVAGDRYTDTSNGNTYQYTTSWQIISYGAGGLTYFSEAQNTTAPNATTPVDSLTAITATTNGDVAIVPKGNGAILASIPNGASSGGNKRGIYSVDLQTTRTVASQVASGEGAVLVGGVDNTASGQGSAILGSIGCVSSGIRSFVMGRNGTSSGTYSLFFGNNGQATANYSFAFGFGTNASGENSVSFGGNATADYSIAFGVVSTASGLASFVAGGLYCNASARSTFATGETNLANGNYSSVFGQNGSSKGIASRFTLGGLDNIAPYVQGNSQMSIGVIATQTIDATPTSLLAYNGTSIALPLKNNEAIRFKGSIIGKQSASTNVSVWDFDGVIVRNTTEGSTILSISNVNLVVNSIASGTPTLTADTINGGLDVKVIGLVATTIKWSCNIISTESILA